MRLFNALLASSVFTISLAPCVHASTIYPGSTPAMATDKSFSLGYNSSSAHEGLSFIIDGYGSLDGKNGYEDDFSLKVNNQQMFVGTFNLGGGSNSGSQANIYFNPFGATFSNLTNNGTAIGWDGGKELISFLDTPLNIGLNTLTFTYTSLSGPGYAGFQGLGDEGWGVEKVQASATPLASSWTMLMLGLGVLGLFAHKKQKRASGLAAA